MTTIPAEELREAARLMRERAEAATQGPWQHMCLGSEGCQVVRKNGTVRERGRCRVARFGMKDWMADHADAEFVTSMNPLAAKALARWLDITAKRAESELVVGSGKLPIACRLCSGLLYEDCYCGWTEALDTARAYLGTREGGGND
jgi:hypothetical protein